MSDLKRLILVFSLGLFFSLLFFKESIGLNLALYEIACFLSLAIFKQLDFKNLLLRFSFFSQGLSLISILWNYSDFSILVHLLFILITIGILVYPKVRNLFNALLLSLYSIICAPFNLVIKTLSSINNRSPFTKSIFRFKYILIPTIIIVIFIIIYRNANPQFNTLLLPIDRFFSHFIPNIFKYLNIEYMFTLIIGILFSSFLFILSVFNEIKENEEQSSDFIVRKKRFFSNVISFTALNKELKSGVFLLFVLNIVLLVVNTLDIYWVWFNFKWNGEYLKQFVHEGTYLLIISILLSAIIVLYYYRNNQNFFKKSSRLKQLSYFWIAQNVILCISVGIRNYWYIDYFNLAYKRIGVYVFLIMVVYGLYTIYIKVKDRRSNYYLIRMNSISVLIVLLITCLFNWDVIIAKHNLKNADHSFVHFDFLSDLSLKALPYLDHSLEELKEIERDQIKIFAKREQYMTAEQFYKIVRDKKIAFLKDYSRKGWLSWNYSDYKTAKELRIKD